MQLVLQTVEKYKPLHPAQLIARDNNWIIIIIDKLKEINDSEIWITFHMKLIIN